MAAVAVAFAFAFEYALVKSKAANDVKIIDNASYNFFFQRRTKVTKKIFYAE